MSWCLKTLFHNLKGFWKGKKNYSVHVWYCIHPKARPFTCFLILSSLQWDHVLLIFSLQLGSSLISCPMWSLGYIFYLWHEYHPWRNKGVPFLCVTHLGHFLCVEHRPEGSRTCVHSHGAQRAWGSWWREEPSPSLLVSPLHPPSNPALFPTFEFLSHLMQGNWRSLATEHLDSYS